MIAAVLTRLGRTARIRRQREGELKVLLQKSRYWRLEQSRHRSHLTDQSLGILKTFVFPQILSIATPYLDVLVKIILVRAEVAHANLQSLILPCQEDSSSLVPSLDEN